MKNLTVTQKTEDENDKEKQLSRRRCYTKSTTIIFLLIIFGLGATGFYMYEADKIPSWLRLGSGPEEQNQETDEGTLYLWAPSSIPTSQPSVEGPTAQPLISTAQPSFIRPLHVVFTSSWPANYANNFGESLDYEATYDDEENKKGVVSGVYSLQTDRHAGIYRIFRFQVTAPVGEEISSEVEAGKKNGFREHSSVRCKTNMALTHIRSDLVHKVVEINGDHRLAIDYSWTFKCGAFKDWRISSDSSNCTMFENYAKTIRFQCPIKNEGSYLDEAKTVLVGVESRYDENYGSRIFDFTCCKMTRNIT